MLAAQSFAVPPTGRIEFGAGAVRRLPAALRLVGHERAFVVSDPGVRAAGVLDQVLVILAEAGIRTCVFAEVEPNPSVATLASAVGPALEFGPAAVVPVGGGSSLDAAKGIALLATHGGDLAVLDYGSEPSHPAPPLVAVPTTAGTGAETNGFGVIADPAGHRKIYIGHASLTPRVAILDPELTVGLPPAGTAATGTDALVHGVESLASLGRNPVSEAYAHQAVTLVHQWLPAAVADGTDLEARSRLLLGAHLAGLALTLSGLGLVHGIAHAVTAYTGAAHGIALAAVLEPVLRFNARGGTVDNYAGLAFDLGVGERGGSTERNAGAAIDELRRVTEQVGSHTPLGALGCTEQLLPDLTRTALADAVTGNNPRRPSPAQLTELLRAAL
ncbi:MAG TPA: iron-containing alcohol dehydrogenase [Pseudonocardia sp.]|jgi:alcohol dehydrogenase class IV|nr:iron-containing alcohol dehydrogenase [Pseudonocardia sp.]